jgi:hypothetical protein
MEAFGTFMLCYVVLMMAAEKNHSRHLAPLVIGFTVFVDHLILIPFTGCSVNPARSFGSNVVSGIWTNAWVWWVGPIIGSLMSVLMFTYAKGVNYAALNGSQDDDDRDTDFIEGLQRFYQYGAGGIKNPTKSGALQSGQAKVEVQKVVDARTAVTTVQSVTTPPISASNSTLFIPGPNGVVQASPPVTQQVYTPVAPGASPILEAGQSIVYLPAGQSVPLQTITTVPK